MKVYEEKEQRIIQIDLSQLMRYTIKKITRNVKLW